MSSDAKVSNPTAEGKERLIRDVGFDRYFRPGTWAEYNRQFFDGLAVKYDATNALHSFGTKPAMDRAAVARLPIPEHGRVLDVCAGSGDISIGLARLHPGARVVGVDVSVPMLEVARRKAAGLENVEFVTGDAMRLPFPDASFDAAIISFGLRNITDIEAGLREMIRVVRPGGWISNIDQGKPSRRWFRALYQVYFYHVAPILGKIVFHRGEFNSFRYLPESNRYFPDQSQLAALFRRLGLEDVRIHEYWLGAVAQQVGRVPQADNGPA